MNHYDKLHEAVLPGYSRDLPLGGTSLRSQPKHVFEAICAIDLRRNALERAIAGAKWLDRHGPKDWRLQMMSIRDGIVYSNVHLQVCVETPLSLAFRSCKQVRGDAAECTWSLVAGRLGFNDAREKEAQELGFLEMEHRVEDTVIDAGLDADFLNEAWRRVLKEYDWVPF